MILSRDLHTTDRGIRDITSDALCMKRKLRWLRRKEDGRTRVMGNETGKSLEKCSRRRWTDESEWLEEGRSSRIQIPQCSLVLQSIFRVHHEMEGRD